MMVEGICGSLLLNSNLNETKLVIDNTNMDCTVIIYDMCIIIDRFQERLISLISQSTNLTDLSLKNCQMDDVCISMLFEVLVKYPNCKLRSLYLDENLHIPEVGKCIQ